MPRLKSAAANSTGTTNEFKIFDDKLVFLQKMRLMALNICFGWLPFFQVITSCYSYKLRLSNLQFGGITPSFGEGFSLESMFKKYLSTLCWGGGCCLAWERIWVDEQIVVRVPVAEQVRVVGP